MLSATTEAACTFVAHLLGFFYSLDAQVGQVINCAEMASKKALKPATMAIQPRVMDAPQTAKGSRAAAMESSMSAMPAMTATQSTATAAIITAPSPLVVTTPRSPPRSVSQRNNHSPSLLTPMISLSQIWTMTETSIWSSLASPRTTSASCLITEMELLAPAPLSQLGTALSALLSETSTTTEPSM